MGMRQISAILGLFALAPIGLMLIKGQLSLPEAATRAGIVLVAVMVVTWLGRLGVAILARSMEAAVPRRRASDVVVED